jgi:hypothetical protein
MTKINLLKNKSDKTKSFKSEENFDMNIFISKFKEGNNYFNEQRIEIFNEIFNTNFSSTQISRLSKNLFTSTSSRINGKKTIMFQIIPKNNAQNIEENTIIQEDISTQNIIKNTFIQEDISTQNIEENIIIKEDISTQNIEENSIIKEDIETKNISQENTIIKEDEEILEKSFELFEEKLRKLHTLKKYRCVNLLEEYDEEIAIIAVNYDDHFNISKYIDLRQKHYEMYEIFNNIDNNKPLSKPRPKPKKEPKKYISKEEVIESFHPESINIANEMYELSQEEYNKHN